jgi:hypothetical protein
VEGKDSAIYLVTAVATRGSTAAVRWFFLSPSHYDKADSVISAQRHIYHLPGWRNACYRNGEKDSSSRVREDTQAIRGDTIVIPLTIKDSLVT